MGTAASITAATTEEGAATAIPAAAPVPSSDSSSNGNGGSNSSGNGNGNNGNGNGGNGNGGARGSGGGQTLPVTNSDADQIRTQVEADSAIPLDQVLKSVAMVSSGRMLEIKPLRIGEFLIYDVTVLEQNGVVRHVMLDAKTGRQVRIQR